MIEIRFESMSQSTFKENIWIDFGLSRILLPFHPHFLLWNCLFHLPWGKANDPAGGLWYRLDYSDFPGHVNIEWEGSGSLVIRWLNQESLQRCQQIVIVVVFPPSDCSALPLFPRDTKDLSTNPSFLSYSESIPGAYNQRISLSGSIIMMFHTTHTKYLVSKNK